MKTLSINNWIAEFDHNRFMYIPLTIILQSCIGSIAAMLILEQGTTLLAGIELSLCVMTCMFYNAALLAQLKSKLCFWMLAASLLVNTIIIFVHILV